MMCRTPRACAATRAAACAPSGAGRVGARGGRLARAAARLRVRASAASSSDAPRVAIVGATGAVGQEFLELLAERDFPLASLKLLASARSAGKAMRFRDADLTVEELTASSFADVDIALFSAGGSISKTFGPAARDAGAVVIDNSSAFRMDEGIPLVVPEINPDALAGVDWRSRTGAIVANPNCSTIIALMAVTPLHRAATVRRMVVSTYQAASGAGQAAMDELVLQTQEALDGKEVTKDIFPLQYAFNLFSHNSDIGPNGYNEEEMKLVKETRKVSGPASAQARREGGKDKGRGKRHRSTRVAGSMTDSRAHPSPMRLVPAAHRFRSQPHPVLCFRFLCVCVGGGDRRMCRFGRRMTWRSPRRASAFPS